MLLINLKIKKRLAKTKVPVWGNPLSCRRLLAFLPGNNLVMVISFKWQKIYKTKTITTCHPSRLLTLGIWNSEGQSHWSSPTETMRRNTNTNIKTGITKHKHSSPQSYRSSLQRQEVQEGESQAGTCDDQLASVELLEVMMDHHWCCRGS